MSIFASTDEPPYDLSNLSVLLVEDSLYMQSLFTSMLKVFGLGDIMVVDHAEEAIDLLKVTQARRKSRYISDIDIIITDWLMPKGPGEDLIRWVRHQADDSLRFTPILVVSAYTTEFVTHTARDLGANETLVKPVSANALAARICTIIDNPRPFVATPSFFGPDRRRKEVAYTGTDRRVMQLDMVEVHNER